MRARAIIVCGLAAFFMSGHNRIPNGPLQKVATNSPLIVPSPRLREAYQNYRAGKLNRAADLYQVAAAEAQARGEWKQAAVGYQNAAGTMLKMGRYRPAAALLARARDLALRAREPGLACIIASNLSALHLQILDFDSAVAEADFAQSLLSPTLSAEIRANVLAQSGSAYQRAGLAEKADQVFAAALHEAAFVGDAAVEARVWDAFGSAKRQARDFEAAERAFVEAFRIRSMRAKAHLALSRARLGILRLETGDFAGARGLLEKAVAAPPQQTAAWPAWSLRYYLGRAHQGEGRLEMALAAYRSATIAARRWREEVPPADAVRIQADVRLQDLYQDYLDVAVRLYEQTGKREFAEDVFAAAEQNRAASLRESLSASYKELPAEYWELLARLRTASFGELKSEDLEAIRSRMQDMEVQAGLLLDPSRGDSEEDSLAVVQRSLNARQAILSFAIQNRASYLLAVTADRFHVLRLPPKESLRALAEQFGGAVRESLPRRDAAGEALAQALFGSLPAGVRKRPDWKLVLDEFLFEAPFAALPAPGEKKYLIEAYNLEILPGALHYSKRKIRNTSHLLAAFGDPLYNRADPRYPKNGGVRPAAFARRVPALNRLTGSREEVLACARMWSGPVLLSLGEDVSSSGLRRAVQADPAVIHLAVHAIAEDRNPADLKLALSLDPSGAPELLGREDIRGLSCGARLVVMSGCSSGWGAFRPGAGLIGLTRAWLQSGAESVVASLWPVPDDDGSMFAFFYRQLDQAGAQALPQRVPEALRAAQLEMTRSGDWRAEPRYWAAYFAVSRGLPR